MARVMLVQPWNYHDEGIKTHDLAHEWRNGPYSLLLLATDLKSQDHAVLLVDMIRDLVAQHGDVDACLSSFASAIHRFRPDIIGFGFFSMHYFEVKKAVAVAREASRAAGLRPLLIAGGIHASVEPMGTLRELGFDYSFVGEGDIGLLRLAAGDDPSSVQGVVSAASTSTQSGEHIRSLDALPFPDWSLCDFRFYSYPSFAKVKVRETRSLDLMMGRGCPYKCAFCAYNALSAVRFYSSGYLVDQIEQMVRDYQVGGLYFTDSTVGNNRRLLREFCELMIRRGLAERVEWYGNIRPNQVNEELLKLMWRAGCRFLLYGFESASQRMLDLMVKGLDVGANYRAVELHNRLRFPYHASMVFGYPGEHEEDLLASIEFLRWSEAPSIGVNWYVPLPGSPDYDRLKAQGIINTVDPLEWRRIGEVNTFRLYSDVPEERFRELFAHAEHLANVEIPNVAYPAWGCIAPPQCENRVE